MQIQFQTGGVYKCTRHSVIHCIANFHARCVVQLLTPNAGWKVIPIMVITDIIFQYTDYQRLSITILIIYLRAIIKYKTFMTKLRKINHKDEVLLMIDSGMWDLSRCCQPHALHVLSTQSLLS